MSLTNRVHFSNTPIKWQKKYLKKKKKKQKKKTWGLLKIDWYLAHKNSYFLTNNMSPLLMRLLEYRCEPLKCEVSSRYFGIYPHIWHFHQKVDLSISLNLTGPIPLNKLIKILSSFHGKFRVSLDTAKIQLCLCLRIK